MTLPSSRKAGFSFASFSTDVSGRIGSSRSSSTPAMSIVSSS